MDIAAANKKGKLGFAFGLVLTQRRCLALFIALKCVKSQNQLLFILLNGQSMDIYFPFMD